MKCLDGLHAKLFDTIQKVLRVFVKKFDIIPEKGLKY